MKRRVTGELCTAHESTKVQNISDHGRLMDGSVDLCGWPSECIVNEQHLGNMCEFIVRCSTQQHK
jgi:hypothetical protein